MPEWIPVAIPTLSPNAITALAVAGPFACALLVDLGRFAARRVALRLRWRRLLPASPIPRDSVLRGKEQGSEGEEWLAELARSHCERKWKHRINRLTPTSLDALRRAAVRQMRRPEHRARFEAHYARAVWEMLGAGEPDVEQRILQACGEMRRRPLWATGRLLNIATFGYLGISPATAFVGLDIQRMRRDYVYYRRESMVMLVTQLGWLDRRIQKWRLGQGTIGLLERRAEQRPPLPSGIVRATPPSAHARELYPEKPDVIARALELLDDADFWVSAEAETEGLAVLEAVERAGRSHRDPAAVARALGGLQQRLGDLREFGAWFEDHMGEGADHRRWPRALGLALADCGDPLTEEEFRLRSMQRFLTGPAEDRRERPPEPECQADPEPEPRPAVLLPEPAESDQDSDPRRAEALF